MLQYKRVIKRLLALSLLTVMIFFIVSAAKFVKEETKSSKYQSEYLSNILISTLNKIVVFDRASLSFFMP